MRQGAPKRPIGTLARGQSQDNTLATGANVMAQKARNSRRGVTATWEGLWTLAINMGNSKSDGKSRIPH